MFGNSKDGNMTKVNPTEASSAINIIGTGTAIIGDITSTGDIRIDGTLTGTVKTSGKLVLGTTGVIDGDIICQNADISGNIKGKLAVSELLSLKAVSKIAGDIVANKLSIEPGAIFTGTCTMGGVIKETRQENNKQESKQPQHVGQNGGGKH
jgi:cytoskeletal protein CcmA (bactofilin family)